jgi:predicted secreted protein
MANRMLSAFFPVLLAVPLLTAAGPALQLDSAARAEVPNDEMVVTLAVEHSGPQVGELNDTVLSRLNDAIAKAKSVPKVDARLGGVTTQPNWSDGRQVGWQVRGEVVLESLDMEALSVLSGRLAKDMQLTGVNFRLSPARRMAEEKELLQEAASNFREKAASAAKAFGFSDYELRELSLQHKDGVQPPRPMMMRAASAEMAPVPPEGGRSEIVVTVSGTVELK